MVGHTANFQATVLAIESIDLALTRINKAVAAAHGVLVVTADHGNADDKVERNKDGEPLYRADGTPVWRTAHSLNPVPFWVKDYTGRKLGLADVHGGGLANVAATLLDLLGFAPPADYEPSLVTAIRAG